MPSWRWPPISADQYEASPLNGQVVWNDVEQLHAHVVLRQVVAGRQPGLVEAHHAGGVGEQLAVEPNLDMYIAGVDRDGVSRAHVSSNGLGIGPIPPSTSRQPARCSSSGDRAP
jgi:hypothetical protein